MKSPSAYFTWNGKTIRIRLVYHSKGIDLDYGRTQKDKNL